MSTTVRSYGFIAVLKTPVSIEEIEDGDFESSRQELSEKLYDVKSNLDITYNGELAYLDYNRHKPMREREYFYGLTIQGVTEEGSPQDLIDEAKKHGLEVYESTIRSYNCIWYNGADCPVDQLEKDEYLELIWSQG